MNPQIAITDMGGGRVGVSAPYSPALINKFRELGGKWEKPFWTFNDSPMIRDAFANLWGRYTSGVLDWKNYAACDLVATGGQLMLGGYVIASDGGRVGVKYANGIEIQSGFCAVVDGHVTSSPDFQFKFLVPNSFNESTAHLSMVAAPPPKGSKKSPIKKPFSAALATPAPSAASVGNMIDLDEMDRVKDRADKARDVITLVLAMLEDGTVDVRTVQQRCRSWLGFGQDNRELASVTMHGVPTGFVQVVAAGTPWAGPVGAPVPSPVATVDTFDQLKAMFG